MTNARKVTQDCTVTKDCTVTQNNHATSNQAISTNIDTDVSAPSSQMLLVTIIAYLNDLLSHLLKNQDHPTFNLLLISTTPTSTQITSALKQQLLTDNLTADDVKVTLITPKDFLQSKYRVRFDLGCLIDVDYAINADAITLAQINDASDNPNLPTHSQADINKATVDNIAFISTRLRDLFANQCVVILDTSNSRQVNLRGLGYTQVAVTPPQGLLASNHNSEDNAVMAQQDLAIWQFNLYDYKPEPDWLNARYWANPENFDKYRW